MGRVPGADAASGRSAAVAGGRPGAGNAQGGEAKARGPSNWCNETEEAAREPAAPCAPVQVEHWFLLVPEVAPPKLPEHLERGALLWRGKGDFGGFACRQRLFWCWGGALYPTVASRRPCRAL